MVLKTQSFQAKLETYTKSKKNNSIDICVFGYEYKEKHPICVSKKFCQEKYVDLLLIEEKGNVIHATALKIILQTKDYNASKK